MTFKYIYRGFFLGLVVTAVLFFITGYCSGSYFFGVSGPCPALGDSVRIILSAPVTFLSLITNGYLSSDGWGGIYLTLFLDILAFTMAGLLLDLGGNKNLSWWGKYIALALVILFCLWIYFGFFK